MFNANFEINKADQFLRINLPCLTSKSNVFYIFLVTPWVGMLSCLYRFTAVTTNE